MTPAARRFSAAMRRWHLEDQSGNLTLLGVFAVMWGGMAVCFVAIYFVFPYLGYIPLLALPALFIFAVVGAMWGFAKRWWENRQPPRTKISPILERSAQKRADLLPRAPAHLHRVKKRPSWPI